MATTTAPVPAPMPMATGPSKPKTTIKDWEEFESKARDLCTKNPTTVRCVVKFRNKENVAVLKLMAGSQVVKFKTMNPEDIGKIEDFNMFFLSFAAGVKEEEGKGKKKKGKK